MTNQPALLPLRRAEVAVQRFNAPASGVPHHVRQLRVHRQQVERCVAAADWSAIRREQINAARIIKQLKAMLVEMDELRTRIRPDDAAGYDELVRPGRELALGEMNAYLQLDLTKPAQPAAKSNPYDDDYSPTEYDDTSSIHSQQQQQQQQRDIIPAIQCDFNAAEHQLQSRRACLRELELLHRDVADLHGIFHRLHADVAEQAEAVADVERNVETSAIAVVSGERHLRQALSYKKAMYPVMGALMGMGLGGPVGLLAGLKVGGLAAVGCGILGYTGGAAIQNGEAQQEQEAADAQEAAATDAGVEATTTVTAASDRKND